MKKPTSTRTTVTVSTEAEAEAEARRKYLKVDAVDPTSGKTRQVHLCHRRLMIVADRSMGQVKEAKELVPFALQFPTAIFEGLCWDDDEPKGRSSGWRCYVTVPERAFAKDGREVPPYHGEVFLVFVNAEGVAYHWYWTKCDGDDSKIPDGMQGDKPRFRTRLL